MIFSYPKYYEEFRCIADKCEDSCCQEWEVDVDDEAAAYYQNLPGQLGDRLRQVMKRIDGGVRLPIENGRCPMWRQDGLCEIQFQEGHEALCHTCRTFPRLSHEYEGFTERDLELSCPEAARMIFSGDETPVTEEPMPEITDEVMEILLQSRHVALDLMANSTYSLPQKLMILLLYAHHVQSWIDGGEEAVLTPEDTFRLTANIQQQGQIAPILEFYQGLEILTQRWKERLETTAAPVWDERLVRFMTYGIRRYWLQAVSDWDLLCRVKFLIGGCILLAHLGGDLIATAQLWSKEIENDPDNVERLLDGAYTSPAFTDLNLLSLLKA